MHVLGLDLGAGSVGWALVRFDADEKEPQEVIATGSRVFDPAVDGELEQGKEEARNLARRAARMMRRQGTRRTRREAKIYNCLKRVGLLPDAVATEPHERHLAITALDRELVERHCASDEAVARQLPYWLRARALDTRLEPDELGRALYHLAQRRGFLTNRKAPPKDGEDEGTVKKNIRELHERMAETGTRTLGEYLASIDPIQEERLRNRWTGRDMYLAEFEAIWAAQQPHHPELLTDSLREELHHAIFFQRPLKSAKHLRGKCELEPERTRCPWALEIAQRFRMLQRVNDLWVELPDGSERELDAEERAKLLARLEQVEDLKFTEMRNKILGLSKGTVFNLERGGEKKLWGNRTAARLRKVFGEAWDAFDPERKAAILHDLQSIQKEETLVRRAMRVYGLDPAKAQALADVRLEQTFCAHSRKALEKLVPVMERGTSYATAKVEVYGDAGWKKNALEWLPPIAEAEVSITNPAVLRTLSELRKVVNHIIRRYGKPDKIRIELARDLKRPRHERAKMWKTFREREKERKAALERIHKELGSVRVSRDDIDKVLLADECGWHCPYTGKAISMRGLVGEHPQFDIEHIIPFSRCLDNSFLNKTLCYHEENRTRKGNRTPQETYTKEELDAIIGRVNAFTGNARSAKLKRFLAGPEELEQFMDFPSRSLNDTRYASTEAGKYLGWLYGEAARKHIQVNNGQITADLRNAWNLNGILSDGPKKTRDDHRHHAVDALVVALAGPRAHQILSYAASRQVKDYGRVRGYHKLVEEPWPNFNEEVRDAILAITVSHRPNRKVNGRLHKDTLYSAPTVDEKGKARVRVRKPLINMSAKEVDQIVDDRIRALVKARMAEMGKANPADAFKNPIDCPRLPNKKDGGPGVPIYKARIWVSSKTFTVGKGNRERHVVPAANHHAEIIETTNKKGEVVWEDHIVDQFTAMQRHRAGEPVVKRDHGPGTKFLFSLAPGDVIELEDDHGDRVLAVMRTVSSRNYLYVRIEDARMKKDIIEAGDRKEIKSTTAMIRRGLRKMTISPLGEAYPCND